jgi:hypothetical protein
MLSAAFSRTLRRWSSKVRDVQEQRMQLFSARMAEAVGTMANQHYHKRRNGPLHFARAMVEIGRADFRQCRVNLTTEISGSFASPTS